LLSRGDIPFGAFLVYSPYGRSKESTDSRDLTYRMKKDGIYKGERIIEYTVRRLKKLSPPELAEFFGASTTVVPVPRSSLLKPATLWVPRRICEALKAQGLAGEVCCCLKRVTAVSKSAGASERPSPKEHYESLRVDLSLVPSGAITLVDDVITRGATVYGAFYRMKEAFPKATIRIFTVTRAISPGEVERIVEPCQGTITYQGENSLKRIP
jgi:predicted amidophosphoribosyltransferase